MKFLEQLESDWMELLSFHERPFRAKFIPSKVFTQLDSYKNDPKGLVNFSKKWRTKINFRKKPRGKIYETYVSVGGQYDPNYRQCIIDIYTTNFSGHKFTDLSWRKFKHRYIQTLMHELIHFSQYDRRNDNETSYYLNYKKAGILSKDRERHYLSHFDEIQAYANCCVTELKSYGDKNVKEYLDVNKLKKRCPSSTLKYILKSFNFNTTNNEVISKLFKHILIWDSKYNKYTRKNKRRS